MKRIAVLGLLFAAGCLSGATSPNDVASISITANASPNGVFIGDQVQISAAAFDFNGNVLATTITFATSNASVVTVSSTGLITAVGAGTANVGVSAGGRTVNVPVQVDGNVTNAVGVFPTSQSLHVGGTGIFVASAATTIGNPARNKSFTWTSADVSKATVDSSGTVTAKAVTAGIQICATVTDGSAKQGCATLFVTP